MKIYLFNPENGVYMGEDFADEEPVGRGLSRIPDDATTIAPPVFGNGETPVFNVKEERWEIRRIKDLQEKFNGKIDTRTRNEVSL